MKTNSPRALAIAATLALLLPTTACAATGPTARDFQRVVDEAHAKFKNDTGGKNADYIPILATVPSALYGVVIATREGKIYKAGDTDYAFSIQSVSKPFTAALIMTQQGPQAVRDKIGVEPTGLPFNSKMALELYPKQRSVNPLVNAGAIAAVSLVQANGEQDRWNQILNNISDFAGRPLTVL
jgi:glutaminase